MSQNYKSSDTGAGSGISQSDQPTPSSHAVSSSVPLTHPISEVAIGIITSRSNAWRNNAMNITWVADAVGIAGVRVHVVFFTDEEDARQGPDIHKCKCSASKFGLACKNDCLFDTLGVLFPKADWYVRLLDDTWVIPDNLVLQLEKLNPKLPYLVGDLFTSPGNYQCSTQPAHHAFKLFSSCYPGGGGGAAVSQASMSRFLAAPAVRMGPLAEAANSIADDVFLMVIFGRQYLDVMFVGDFGFTMLPAALAGVATSPVCTTADLQLPAGCNLPQRPGGTICVAPIVYPSSVHVGNDPENINGVVPVYASIRRNQANFMLVLPPEMYGPWRWKVCIATEAQRRTTDEAEPYSVSQARNAALRSSRTSMVNIIVLVSQDLQALSAHLESMYTAVDVFVIVEPNNATLKLEQSFATTRKWPHFGMWNNKIVYVPSATAYPAMHATPVPLWSEGLTHMQSMAAAGSTSDHHLSPFIAGMTSTTVVLTLSSSIVSPDSLAGALQHDASEFTPGVASSHALHSRELTLYRQRSVPHPQAALYVLHNTQWQELPRDPFAALLDTAIASTFASHVGWHCHLCGGTAVAVQSLVAAGANVDHATVMVQTALETSTGVDGSAVTVSAVADIPVPVAKRQNYYRFLVDMVAVTAAIG